MLLGTIEPELDNASFLVAMGVLGVGMGLIVSQLGNVVQSAVGDRDRSEAGGLQNTAQQLGSSLGTALLGAIVISGLIVAFTSNIADDPRISADVDRAGRGAAERGRQLRLLRGGARDGAGGGHRPGDRRRPGRELRRRAAEGAEDRLPLRRLPRPRLLLVDAAAADAALRRAAGGPDPPPPSRRPPDRSADSIATASRVAGRARRRRQGSPRRQPRAPATASGRPPAIAPTRSSCSSARPARGWASWCRCATAGCWSRPSPSTAAPPR